jgi:adenylyl-sulfate kinase
MVRPQVIWLTGLSGAGKSTLATHLAKKLREKNIGSFIIDGDVLRESFGHDLGFSNEDRSRNVVRAIKLAQEKLQQGLIVIVAMISPFIKDRAHARSQFEPSQFKEVYVSTPLNECESRDPKGLYRKARAGEIKDFTGVHQPYEAPTACELTLPAATQSVDACALQVEQMLRDRHIV